MTQKYNEGDVVQVTGVYTDVESGRTVRKGTLLVVEDYVSAEDSEDGKPFYWATDINGLSSHTFEEVNVEIAPENSTKLPDVEDILEQVSSKMHSGFDSAFSVEETGIHSGDSVYVIGTTENGVRFQFLLTLNNLEKSDW